MNSTRFISHSQYVKVSYQKRRDLKQRSKCCITSEITNWGRRGSVLVTGIILDNPARVSKSHLDKQTSDDRDLELQVSI